MEVGQTRTHLLEGILGAGLVSVLAWCLLYLFFGLWAPALVEGVFGVMVLAHLLVARRAGGRRFKAQVMTISSAVLVVCVLNTWAMGGLVESGMFVIWGLIVPIGVLVLLGPTAGALAIVGYAGCVALCASGYRPWPELPSLPPEVASVMIAGNIVGTGLLVGIAVTWTLNRLEHEERVRAKMQAESMRAQKLEAIGTLAAGIAHDFNNILMAFGGHVTHARRTTRPEDPANASLVKAERALEQAAGLARQLLAFSKGGAPVRTVASLAEVVRDSTTFVLHGSNCACVFEAPPDLWPVEGDASQISQVIQNIALNAAQAMPDGGTVSVACANVPPGADMHGKPADRKYVSVSVSDSGVGVP